MAMLDNQMVDSIYHDIPHQWPPTQARPSSARRRARPPIVYRSLRDDGVPNQCFFLHGDMVLLVENVDLLWLLLGRCGFTNRICGLL
jgi:hypothetical protein